MTTWQYRRKRGKKISRGRDFVSVGRSCCSADFYFIDLGGAAAPPDQLQNEAFSRPKKMLA
jgi:hypothetical protein